MSVLAKCDFSDGWVQAYDRMRDEVLGHRVRDGGWFDAELTAADLPEIELQSLWFGGAFGRDFRDSLGREVRVVQFGVWNHAAGPDFLHASVDVDGERMVGAIELDTDVRDWEHHGHASNPAYENVVLHLFFNAPDEACFTRTESHRDVVQVRLDASVLVEPAPMVDAHPGRCLKPLELMGAERVRSLLVGAAMSRAKRKARRFLRCADIHGPREAWFQAMAECLGYRRNKLPMRALAQTLPLRELMVQPAEAAEALLFGTAGFLEAPDDMARDDETSGYLRALWRHWWRARPVRDTRSVELPWVFAGQRPVNHPHRRLGALAAVVADWHVLEKVVTGGMDGVDRRLSKFCDQLEHGYWSHHFTLTSAPSAKRLALIGRDRWRDFLVNFVLPVAMNDHRSEQAAAVYLKLPAGALDEASRIAALRLFGASELGAEVLKNHAFRQGLLAVYEDFCLRDDSGCAGCSFPEQLRQWGE
ncbi:DUF2851 family protein [Sulfuriroseicoccus oceanibius]|uniref:DUF2851 family protein n=1 Tax=Sulfuriroseicoccus oceanibius TaxID=2707525 RepID=A0A6B3LDQ8_9BACT|nr:DUF2851 family protein [Sulfuriroseicoccus oceanibius]QQL45094.1 DUF2851 family protein [Sulfuriroseicoccus oceanibius]